MVSEPQKDVEKVKDTLQRCKTFRCPAGKSSDLLKALEGMRKGDEFSLEAAVKVNQPFGARVIRDTFTRVDGVNEPFKPDKLWNDLNELQEFINQGSEIHLQVMSEVQVKKELIGLTLQEGAPGVGARLDNVVGHMLSLQVVCTEKPGEEPNFKPRYGDTFAAGQTVWCQFKNWRHTSSELVVSPEVAKVLIGDHVSINPCPSCENEQEQILVLPAVRRLPGATSVPEVQRPCPLPKIFKANDVPDIVAQNVTNFFYGFVDPSTVEVSLKLHPVRIEQPGYENVLSGPHTALAVCGRKNMEDMKKGWPCSSRDMHGCRPRSDVEKPLDARKTTQGLSFVHLGHSHKPQFAEHVDERSSNDDLHWEIPGDPSVVYPDSKLVLLRQVQNDGENVKETLNRLFLGTESAAQGIACDPQPVNHVAPQPPALQGGQGASIGELLRHLKGVNAKRDSDNKTPPLSVPLDRITTDEDLYLQTPLEKCDTLQPPTLQGLPLKHVSGADPDYEDSEYEAPLQGCASSCDAPLHHSEARRVDPMCQDCAVTYAEMCRGLANEELSEDQLRDHWGNLKPAEQDDQTRFGHDGIPQPSQTSTNETSPPVTPPQTAMLPPALSPHCLQQPFAVPTFPMCPPSPTAPMPPGFGSPMNMSWQYEWPQGFPLSGGVPPFGDASHGFAMHPYNGYHHNGFAQQPGREARALKMESQGGKAACRAPDQRAVQRDLQLLQDSADFGPIIAAKGTGKLDAQNKSLLQVKTLKIQNVRQSRLLLDLFARLGTRDTYCVIVIYAMDPSSVTVAQRAFALANTMQKNAMVCNIESSVQLLIQGKHGCIFLQQVIEEACIMMEALRDQGLQLEGERGTFIKTVVDVLIRKHLLKTPESITEYSNHENAGFVVQKLVRLLQLLPDTMELDSEEVSLLPKFMQEIGKRSSEVGKDNIGCRVFLRLLEGRSSQLFAQMVIEWSALKTLIPSKGGNHVVQQLLDHGSTEVKLTILNHVYDNFRCFGLGQWALSHEEFYAANFFGRHVVQKCFPTEREDIQQLRECRASILNIVLLPGGQVNPSFEPESFTALSSEPHVLEAMWNYRKCQREQVARNRPSAKSRSTWQSRRHGGHQW